MQLSYWHIIIAALAAQGLFLAFLILVRKSKVLPGRLYLSLFIFLYSVMLLLWVGFWKDYPSRYPHFNYLYDPIPLLLGPLFFFFIKSQFELLKQKDIVHIFPFLLAILWYMPFYLLSVEQKYLFMNTPGGDLEIWKGGVIARLMHSLHVLSLMAYSIFIHIYLKNRLIDLNLNKKAERLLSYIKYLFGIFSILYTLHYFTRDFSFLPVFVEYANSILIGIFFYIIGYLSLSFSPLINDSNIDDNSEKYSRSRLDSGHTEYLMNKIVSFIEENKPYLNESYKLSELSADMGIPTYHISELLNKYYEKNFSELINTYRINEAKILLLSEAYENKTVSAIGHDVGFSSRTTFHNWFKKITGLSPAAFQKQHKVCSK